MSNYKVLFAKQGGAFVDPAAVGSSIQWRVTYKFRLADPTRKEEWTRRAADATSCELAISDCSRVIDWSIGVDVNSLYKLDNAIRELTACRAALAKALAVRNKTRAKNGLNPLPDEDD